MADANDVRSLAALARLSIPEERVESFAREFDAVLSYIGKLDELALDETSIEAGAVRNAFREDADPHDSGLYTDALVEQFPEKEGNHLSVKKIISYD